jgi:acetoacetyl-CoA synthetase
VLLRAGIAQRPVFFVHGVAGDVMHLRPLALSLGTERPVYGIQSRGLDPLLTPQERVEDMAEANLVAIRNVQPAGPYSIVGHSFGALVAFEMARRLELEGAEVGALALVEPVVHHRCLSRPARVRFVTSLVAGRARRHQWRVPGSVLPPLQERVERANREAFRAYRPGPYRGDATLLLADGEEAGFCDPLPVWRGAICGTLDLAYMPGGHATVVGEPHAHMVAERLTALLAAS